MTKIVSTRAEPAPAPCSSPQPCVEKPVFHENRMNRYYWILGAFAALVALLAVGLNLNPRDVPSPWSASRPPPSISQLAEPDKTLSPKDMQGKVWLLNVWASWCVSCRQEHRFWSNSRRRSISR
jgi:thiol:disulfide interchange protein